MAQGGVLGNGVKVAYSTTSPVSWTRVTQVLEVGFPTLVPDDVDTSVHGTSKFKRSMAGMIKVGDLTLTLLSDTDPATSVSEDAIWGFNQTQETIWWRVEVPANREQTEFSAFELQGYVAQYSLDTKIADAQKTTVTIRFDGDSLTKYDPAASAI